MTGDKRNTSCREDLNTQTMVCRLGMLDPRPGYHTETQLWPIGYWARASIPEDPTHSYLLSKIISGGDDAPLFTVSTKLPFGSSAEETVVSACHFRLTRGLPMILDA